MPKINFFELYRDLYISLFMSSKSPSHCSFVFLSRNKYNVKCKICLPLFYNNLEHFLNSKERNLNWEKSLGNGDYVGVELFYYTPKFSYNSFSDYIFAYKV